MATPYLHRPPGRRPAEPRTWFHEFQYQAKCWSRPRRVVLVVLEREEELFLHHFWLITNWSQEQMDGAALLEEYRKRGTAEGHQGELMSVLAPLLSSTERPKTTYAGHRVTGDCPSLDAFAVNEVRLLLNALAYNLMHAVRALTEKATGEGWAWRTSASECSRSPHAFSSTAGARRSSSAAARRISGRRSGNRSRTSTGRRPDDRDRRIHIPPHATLTKPRASRRGKGRVACRRTPTSTLTLFSLCRWLFTRM